MTDQPTHVVWHKPSVSRPPGYVVWFTGLSGSGKSTIANRVDEKLYENGLPSFVLDGDNIRHGLNASPELLAPIHGEAFAKRFGLGFGVEDREENIRRIGCVAELFCSSGIIALTAFVSPYRRDRDRVRQRVTSLGREKSFIEVFVDTPIAICEQRDPKGHYKRARAGELKQFTGIDDPYEPPLEPELRLDGTKEVEELADEVVECIREHLGS